MTLSNEIKKSHFGQHNVTHVTICDITIILHRPFVLLGVLMDFQMILATVVTACHKLLNLIVESYSALIQFCILDSTNMGQKRNVK